MPRPEFSGVDRGLETGRITQTITLVFVASPQSKQNLEVRAKTGWLGIRIMCPSGQTCIPAELKKGNNMVKYEKARLEEGNS